MTWFVNFRTQDKRGSVSEEGLPLEATGQPPGVIASGSDVERRFRAATVGKRVLFVSHGFNVDKAGGVSSAMKLETLMMGGLGAPAPPIPFDSNCLFVGILWPGDWYNVLNYPFEAVDAKVTGKRLGTFIKTWCREARSVSFASHSLGARVILTAAEHVDRAVPVEKIILTAPAADEDCLVKQHAAGFKAASEVYVLSSERDRTLRFLYPVGDFLSDLLGDGDSPFRGALGYRGPNPRTLAGMLACPIPEKPRNQNLSAAGFDHCHYFPPSGSGSVDKPRTVAHYINAALAGRELWP